MAKEQHQTQPKSPTLLSTLLQHLPDILNNTKVASTAFSALRSASNSHKSLPFISPALPPITSVVLIAAIPHVRTDAALTCVALTQALVTRRLSNLASAYISDLAAAARRIIEHHSSHPLSAVLPNFIEYARSSTTDHHEIASLNALKIPPIPVSPKSLERLLLLIASFVPSNLPHPFSCPPSAPSDSKHAAETDPPSTVSATSIRLWVCLSPCAREAVLELAASFLLLSGRCGTAVALAAVKILERALDPASGCTVPIAICERLSSVIEAVLFDIGRAALPSPDKTKMQIALYRLAALVSSTNRLPPSLWTTSGVHDAVVDDGELGVLLRSFSKCSLTSYDSPEMTGRYAMEQQALVPSPTQPARKKRRVNESSLDRQGDDLNSPQASSLSQEITVSKREAMSSPVSALKWELQALDSITTILEEEKSVLVLGRVAGLAADAVSGLMAEPNVTPDVMEQWFAFSSSLALIVHDAFGNVMFNMSPEIWGALLATAVETVRLALSLLSVKLTPHSNPEVDAAVAAASLSEDSSLMIESALNVLINASTALDPKCSAKSLQSLSSLMQQTEDVLRTTNISNSDKDKLTQASFQLVQQILERYDEFEDIALAGLLLRSCSRVLVALRPQDLPTEAKAAIDKTLEVFLEKKAIDASFAGAALCTMGDLLCLSVRCHVNHNAESKDLEEGTEPSGCIDENTWTHISEPVFAVLRGTGADELLTAASYCCGVLVFHAPETKAGEASSVLIRTAWHPTCTKARQTAVSFLSAIFVRQSGRRFRNTSADAPVSQAFPDCGSEDSWDGLDVSFTLRGDMKDNIRILGAELQERVKPLEYSLMESMSLKATTDVDITPLPNLLRLQRIDPVSAKVVGLAMSSLLSCAIVELQNWKSTISKLSSSEGDFQDTDTWNHNVKLRSWGGLLRHVANTSTTGNIIEFSTTSEKTCFEEKVKAGFSGDIVKGMEPLGIAVSTYFGSRMKDWLPFTFRKMIHHDSFSMQLVDTMVFRDVLTLWKKVPKHVVGPLLRCRDSVTLDSVSSRTGRTARNLVEIICSDALARAALIQGVGLDLAPDGMNSLISQSLQQPLQNIISSRAGKIVQRVVMELGGAKDVRARKALSTLAEVMGHRLSGRSNAAGLLVASHFMLVMDAVNRGLFHSKAKEKERIRYLRMLDIVLSLTSDYLHMYVPKILATLKMALEWNRGSPVIRTKTLQVWCCFLRGLGGERVLPHLCSVLSILIPFVESHDTILCDTLTKLLDKAMEHPFRNWPEVILLLKIAKISTLTQTAKRLESQLQEASSRVTNSHSLSVKLREDPLLTTQKIDLVENCETICKVICRQESVTIKEMAIDYLLTTLKANRARIDRTLIESSKLHESSNVNEVQAISKLLSVLVSSFSTVDSKVQMKVMQCIGEIGAVDPGIVSRFESASSEAGLVRNARLHQLYPRRVHALACLLLNNYLAPALTRRKQRGAASNHENRAGLVIQELLRVCGCKRDTAARAGKTVRRTKTKETEVEWDKILIGETAEENAIYFWEQLDGATKTAVEPYLSEPFDIDQYKHTFGGNAGDVPMACEPVWSKIKVAARSGTIPTAQEWRHQVAVQLVDFIGKHGRYGSVLRALRPVLRYNDDVTGYIFPLVVTTALDIQKGKESVEVQEFLSNEIAAVLKEGVSPQPVFELFDNLRLWREERSKARGKLIPVRSQGYGKIKLAILANIERERVTDSLSPLVDLNGHESPVLSLLLQAKAAFRARSFSRAIMFAEYFLRNLRIKRRFPQWPACVELLHGGEGSEGQPHSIEEQEVLEILQRSFAELEDPASMAGITTLRASCSLADSVADSEVAGRYDKALVRYERALAEDPRSLNLHNGFMRCLMTLGHWETMLSHADGLVSSAKMSELNLRLSAQAHGINAAWRLGRWNKVQDFEALAIDAYHKSNDRIATSWELDFNVSFGNMLLSLRDNDQNGLRGFATEARKHLIEPLMYLSREGYARSYQVATLLHCVSEVEDCITLINDKHQGRSNDHNFAPRSDNLRLLLLCNGRAQAAAASLRVREPLLSVRRACLELLGKTSDAAEMNLRLSELAQQSGNLRAASACAYAASKIETLQDATKNAAVLQTAKIRHAEGDAPGALMMIRKEIERLGGGRNGSGSRGFSTMPREVLDQLCTAYVLAGRWIEESRSESSDVIQSYYEQAAALGPSREEPFYALGKHYDTLFQARTGETRGQLEDAKGTRSSRRSAGGTPTGWSLLQNSHYVPQIIKSFTKALCNGHSRVYEVLPRMLTIWFDYHSTVDCSDAHLAAGQVEGEVKREMKRAFNNIPSYMWMTTITQLMSRLLHSRKIVRDELTVLLARIVLQYPDQSAWLISPSSQLKSVERKQATNTILSMAMSLAKKLRSLENENERHALQQRVKTKVQRAICVIRELVQICLMNISKEKRNREENFAEEFKRLKDTLHASTTTTNNPMIPTLRTLTVRMPTGAAEGHRPFDDEPVHIVDIHNYAYIMASLMRPRRITLLGSDGQRYKYLAKKETSGDMRKDSRLMEFMTVVNRLLSKHPLSQKKEITLKIYAVLPLTEESGMIEWVNNLEPLRKLVRDQHDRMSNLPEMSAVQSKHNKTQDKIKFHEWAVATFPAVLDKFFLEAFGAWSDPQLWLSARNLWTQSVASWSMAGYVVGLGDRHGENILVEGTTGRCVHVDFAMLFDKGANLRVPEIVPFRLTQNMVTAMGVAGYEGLYRTVAETVMGVLRTNIEALMGVLESFLYDPLVDWSKRDTKGTNGNVQVVSCKEAWESRAVVTAKLKGIMDDSGLALSTNGQVRRLISDASSAENLSRMYIWWSGWI